VTRLYSVFKARSISACRSPRLQGADERTAGRAHFGQTFRIAEVRRLPIVCRRIPSHRYCGNIYSKMAANQRPQHNYPPFIEWKAYVTDFAGSSKDFKLRIPLPDAGWKLLESHHGTSVREVLEYTSHAAELVVLGCGGPWKCFHCHQKTTRSVNTPALVDSTYPPMIMDYCFIPICEKAVCESFAYHLTQDILEKKVAPKVKKETGRNIMEGSAQICAHCQVDQKQKKLSRCSRCRTVYYCSQQCQLTDWSRHKKFCLQIPKDAHKK